MGNCMGKRKVKKMATGAQVKSKMQQMYERESGLDTPEKLEKARRKARSMMPFAPKEKTRTEKENANEIRRHQGRADQAAANRKKTPKANAAKALIKGTAAGVAAGAAAKKVGNRKKSFPDLNKDGKVTKKDILMGKGVKMAKGGISRETLNKSIGQAMKHMEKNKKKFDGKVVKKMAEGGMAPPKGLNRILEKVAKDKKKFDGRIVKSKKVDGKKYAEGILKQIKKMPKKMATGGKVKGRRGDGICSRGRTKGRIV